MWRKVERFIEQNKLLSKDDCHIVAVSGGADSVALLLVLLQLGYRVEAAHCNFQLRGEESCRDERFVRQLCDAYSVPFHLIHFDTTTYASAHQVSIEMAARELRYRYFEQLRQDIGAGEVCVAHHQDDAVETLLMNLLRGSGIHGLTGIRPRNGHVVRPLLGVSRADILAFLDERQQNYVTDSSNLVANVVRNRIRLQVLPLLNDINPAAAEHIAHTASYLAEAEVVYSHAVRQSLGAIVADGCADIAALRQHPAPLTLLHEWLMPYGFTTAQVEQLYDCLDGPSGRMFQSPTHEVAVDRDHVLLQSQQPTLPTMRVPEAGTYCYTDAMTFRCSLSDGAVISRCPEEATLDADKVLFPLTIRPVQEGERFHPYGMKGSQLVSDYLTNRKRSVFQKRRQLVVTDADNRVVWLVGERTDHRFAVTADTRVVLTIHCSF